MFLLKAFICVKMRNYMHNFLFVLKRKKIGFSGNFSKSFIFPASIFFCIIVNYCYILREEDEELLYLKLCLI